MAVVEAAGSDPGTEEGAVQPSPGGCAMLRSRPRAAASY